MSSKKICRRGSPPLSRKLKGWRSNILLTTPQPQPSRVQARDVTRLGFVVLERLLIRDCLPTLSRLFDRSLFALLQVDYASNEAQL
jgi:hypothetical protein